MSEQQSTTTIIVHPDDVNLADVKALAAQHGANVVGTPYCPRGTALLTKQSARP